uniref:Defensin beta 50 n=1 Tax=Mus spicilegus TaxID=10103 RepID=A0A8C6G7P5_MUSSI
MKTLCFLLLTSGLLYLMVKGVGSHPGTFHVRIKCMPKMAAVFGDNCSFYSSMGDLCNNTKSVCCMVPVRMDNI